MFFIGQQFSRYRLERLIDQGGMGEIYLATDMHLHRHVAIKVVKSVISSRANAESIAEAIRLFQKEAKAVTMLEHPHILPLYDYGEENLDGVLVAYFVMPYRPEGSLASWVNKRGKGTKISLYDVAHFLPQAAGALQYAHDHGIIHRDVKPSNFLLVNNKQRPGRPDLQLTDFGVSKFMNAVATPTNIVRGTPLFMAPEQWKGEAVPASDQYALAVMTYQFLTGRPPFQGENNIQLFHEHAHEQVPDPGRLNSRIPKEVGAVLMKALAKEPERRYKSIDAFARAFKQALLQKQNITMTLVISLLEAQNGSRRLVALPGGRQVAVNIPVGAYDGLVMRLDGLGSPSKFGGPAGDLVITLSIEKTEKVATLAASDMIERPVPARELKPLPPVRPGKKPRSRNKLALVFIGLVPLLLVISGLGVVLYSASHQAGGANQVIFRPDQLQTGTAIASLHASETSGAQLNATATSVAGTATGTALAAATASAVAATQTAVSATKTAVAGVTATSVAATATAMSGILKVGPRQQVDLLQSSNPAFNWDTIDISSGAGCAYTRGTYHAGDTQRNQFSTCFEHQLDLTDFSCQVNMEILQGDIGGIAFRANPGTGSFYYFYIDIHGNYWFGVVNSFLQEPTLVHGSSGAIRTGLNQINQVAVVAKGNTILIFVNMQQVVQVTDSTYMSGNIGLVAQDVNNATDVSFSDMQIWY
jgi:serine/threonine protein kinase